MIEPATLLEAVPGGEPCGANLEYDADFVELLKLSEGKPEQQIGATIIAGEEPDWVQVERKSQALLARTKDLRVAICLVKALVKTSGYPGLAHGLAVLRGLVDTYWDGVHPELDPDDDNDPTMRMNLLAELCDQSHMLVYLRAAPLVAVRALGRFSLRDIAVATGELPAPPKGEPAAPTMATIEAAFNAVELPELLATLEAARASVQHVNDIENIVTEKVGVGNAVSLSKVREMLKHAVTTLEKYYGARAVDEEAEEGADDAGGAVGSDGQPATDGARGRQQRLSGEITSREDVLRAIDKICKYYERYEPGSPVPILLGRCRKLASMSFVDIIRNMAPDAMAQVQLLRGPEEEGTA
jgi:type VI secretion system protein ImpA